MELSFTLHCFLEKRKPGSLSSSKLEGLFMWTGSSGLSSEILWARASFFQDFFPRFDFCPLKCVKSLLVISPKTAHGFCCVGYRLDLEEVRGFERLSIIGEK